MKCLVGFSRQKGIISDGIVAKIGRPYSHTFMVFRWKRRLVVLQATAFGVTAMDWEVFQSKNTIVKLIDKSEDPRCQAAFDYAVSRLGVSYGYLAIIAIGLGIHYADGEKTLICSEYLARAFGLEFDKELDLVTPADIEDKI